MANLAELTKIRIHAGHWEGVLTHPGEMPPALILTHLGTAVDQAQVSSATDASGHPLPGQWLVRARIPAEILCDGMQTFLVCDEASGEKLAHFSLVAGEAVEDDLRAELTLLRAELDMLKKAFRRHCAETA